MHSLDDTYIMSSLSECNTICNEIPELDNVDDCNPYFVKLVLFLMALFVLSLVFMLAFVQKN